MKGFAKSVVRAPIIGPVVLFGYRALIASSHIRREAIGVARWLIGSREITNFTYDLEPTNRRYLAALIAEVTNCRVDEIEGYLDEIDSDTSLREHVASAAARSEWACIADKEARFARRIGWYAFARALKPRVIVETGIDKGLGACVLTAALKRNAEQGFEGRYFGIDIDPEAGYMLTGVYSQFGKILVGDAIETLSAFETPIDLYINDSDHSAEYEAREYAAVVKKMSVRGVMLGDNAHVTDKLLNFSRSHNRGFMFFEERPAKHWYRGGGIGISYVK